MSPRLTSSRRRSGADHAPIQLELWDVADIADPVAPAVGDAPPRGAADVAPVCSEGEVDLAPDQGVREPRTWDTPPATLAEVRRRLGETSLNAVAVRDLSSALKRVGEVLGAPLEAIDTKPKVLRRRLGGANPALLGISERRWQQLRSRLSRALTVTGMDVLPGRATCMRSGLWAELFDKLPTKRLSNGLSRLTNFLARNNIAPREVVPDDFVRFKDELEQRGLKVDHERIWRDSMRLWNKAVETVDGWPKVTAAVPPDARRYALKLEAFTDTFQADVRAYLERGGDPDPFSENYRRPLAPRTVEKQLAGILQIATALTTTGFPVSDLTGLDVLVAPANALAALQELYRARGGAKEYLAWQANLLLVIARHWVKDREAEAALKGMPDRLHKKQPGLRPKNRERLRQFDLPANVEALLTLPGEILLRSEAVQEPTSRQARDVLFALAIELLLISALRIKNLTELRIGQSLVKVRRGRQLKWHILIAPEESKTGQPFEFELPPPTVQLLELYLAKYRPLIRAAEGDFLFVSKVADRRSSISFGTQISKFIRVETGLVMNPHLFRHLAAKLYLDANPHDLETVRRLLGHTSTTTTLKAYAELSNAAAYRRWDGILEAIRAPLNAVPPPLTPTGSRRSS